MSFAPTPEQDELRTVVRDFFAEKSSEQAVRVLMEDERGYDADVWKQMAQQLGLQSLAVPEEYGGAGYGMREMGVVFEEAGRALLCAPLLSQFLTVQALLAAADDSACKELLPSLAAGDVLGSLAWLPEAGSGASGVTASDGRLTGTTSFVLDGHVADLLLIVALAEEGPTLFAVEGNSAGLRRTALATLDQTRKQARLELDNVAGRLVGQAGGAADILREVLDRGCALLTAEQVGGAGRALDLAVEYAKVRQQFGRPIGSFQAIKHKCADMYVLVESARSASYYALWAAAEKPDELALAASLAKAYCSDAYTAVTAENIQVHGGIGFTWEHPAHLYFKRAKSSELLFGTPTEHRERVAALVGL